MGKVPRLKQEDTSAHLVTSLLIKNSSVADLWKMETLGIMDLVETKSKEEMEKNAVEHFMKPVDRRGGEIYCKAPLKDITIPHLELLACCIGARLTSSIRKAMNLEDIPSLYWTDSSTALYWIQHEDHWGTFVNNIVGEIRNLSSKSSLETSSQELQESLLISHHAPFCPGILEIRWWRATINSRPLNCLSEDPNGLALLMPSMFIQETRTVKVPDLDNLDKINISERYQYQQTLRDNLRKRFRDEYLSMLVQRPNRSEARQVKLGDIVIVGSNTKKRLDWPLGKIIGMFPGKDGCTRVVKLKTTGGEIVCPV
ncbi:DUF5641 domain-containing protein [Trichonephila inaurata madagascariensis]|uniref:DUF5641 domain-containing protein n=1 Tax=Trichonephila inaurata madagascariensis TaxID=2747483 RepID=A0A8X6XBB1_9ARAC|nr:DUF5641 domain-containing protein [Trichonephila inaurata madagascariensis]